MTAIEYRKLIEAIPLKKRLQIKDELDSAYMAINRAECLLIVAKVGLFDIPILEDQYSIKACVYSLERALDIENYPDTRL